MDEDKVLTFRMRSGAVDRQPWGDAERATAFELWFLVAGRRLPTLEKILNAEPYNLAIPYQTLWDWQRRYNWDLEADKRLRAVAPNLRDRRGLMLDAAALDAASYVSAANSGAIAPDRERTAVAKLALEAAGVIGGKGSAAAGGGALPAGGARPRLSDAERERLADKLARLGAGESVD